MTDRTAAEQAAEALRSASEVIDAMVIQFRMRDQSPPEPQLIMAGKIVLPVIAEALAALTAESASIGGVAAERVNAELVVRVSPDREALARELVERWSDNDVFNEDVNLDKIVRDITAVALRLPAQAEVEEMACRLDQEAYLDKHNAAGNKSWLASAAAMLRRLSSPSPAVGEWRPIDNELSRFLDGVTGVVEANSYEVLCLWKEARDRKETWIDCPAGFHETIGHLAGMPVCVTLRTATVKDRKLLFIDGASQVVDHRMIDKWLNNVCPQSARSSKQHVNRIDAMNFHNVFRSPAPTQETKP
jgi:hypothetical protein